MALEDCRIRAAEGFPGIKARCGTLVRPENPQDPASLKLDLFVAVVPALSLEPEADPFVPIAGGPGQASTEFYAAYAHAFEEVRRTRDIVLLDQRGTVYSSDDAFEHAVRGAASVMRHLYRAGFSPDLWTLETVPMPTNIDRYRAAMERLATVQMLPTADLFRAVSRMRRRGIGGGALVMVTGEPDDQDVAVFRAMTRDFNRTIVLTVEDKTDDAEVAAFNRAGAVTVVAAPGTAWGPVWRDAMERTWSTVTVG